MVHFAPSLPPSYAPQLAYPLSVREQLALVDGYGPGIQESRAAFDSPEGWGEEDFVCRRCRVRLRCER